MSGAENLVPGESDAADSASGQAASAPTVVVAIDGPAGSGKSSVSKQAALKLGYAYLDTGAAYRALAWMLLDRGLDAENPAVVIESLAEFDFTIGTEPEGYFVKVGPDVVTVAIREPWVTSEVRLVARLPEVRAHLTEMFRSIIRNTSKPGIVVEGRDITTVVAPDATARILLTASEEARMGRRSAELVDQSAAVVGEQLRSRDRADSRVVDFMNAADGVTTVDSTELDFDQTVSAVVEVVHLASLRVFHGQHPQR
ncbi:(d)CMP kinase [Subtercola frigoramans]|uniref:Cytidylate kinase n=1 Tax=Subtercola frigoramans TaxID=120298 RepID=A0ABS2L635_9MICO|nr:(d)CMP kinase [Subtercola frigoramans]MBM7472557.1 cytidylate kinase [Subtercola frigoramans]